MRSRLIALAALAALFCSPAFAAPVWAPGQGGTVGPNVACTNSGAAIRCIQPSVTLNDATGVAIGTSGNPLVTSPATGSSVTLGAGENHVGEVGGNIVSVTVAQTVTAASAYTSGNSIGGLMTVAAAARVAAGSGLIQSVVNYSKSAQTGQVDVFLFSASPSGSTCTDKTAFVLATADFDKLIGVAHVTDWTAGNVASLGQAQTLAMPFALASGTSIFACAVTRSTPTYTATTDVSFGFRILRN